MGRSKGQGVKRRHLVQFAIFCLAWILASSAGMLTDNVLVASLTGMLLGAAIIPVVGYTRDEMYDDLHIGFAQYDAEKRVAMGLVTTCVGVLFCIGLVAAMILLPLEGGRMAGASLGGLMLPHLVNVLSKLRSIKREGVTT
ncbi:hypothetical protein [Citromicrobium bathyomarinum]|uniref:hypothetical protein n=1 Tax=Citromicrobium bathyomarinum TaxID=72174 RepID=UPI001E5FD8C6|nr:hypothetical protein [Citromicrobium bathyomarinum]MCD1621380.1 hypothetical protein [Citromicrobium bathyomarinum]